jgi:hypothetical protein
VKHFIELKLPNFIQLLELPCFTSPGVIERSGNGIAIHLKCVFDIMKKKSPKLYSKKDFSDNYDLPTMLLSPNKKIDNEYGLKLT